MNTCLCFIILEYLQFIFFIFHPVSCWLLMDLLRQYVTRAGGEGVVITAGEIRYNQGTWTVSKVRST
jgi:hypothetical protein